MCGCRCTNQVKPLLSPQGPEAAGGLGEVLRNSPASYAGCRARVARSVRHRSIAARQLDLMDAITLTRSGSGCGRDNSGEGCACGGACPRPALARTGALPPDPALQTPDGLEFSPSGV